MTLLKFVPLIVSVIVESCCTTYVLSACMRIINLDKSKINIKKFLHLFVYVLISTTIGQILNYALPDLKWIKPIIFICLASFGLWRVRNTNAFKSIIVSIIFLVISAILEILSVLILKSLEINIDTILGNVFLNNLMACLLGVAGALFAGIAFTLFKIFNSNLTMVDNKLKYFLPQLIAIVICLFPTMMLLIFSTFRYPAIYIIVNLIQLLTVACVGIYTLKFVVKHELTEEELANTITYNETLSKVNEGVRGFKHDMGNIVQAILGYIAIKDADGAKNYCQNLVIGFNDINVLSILSPKVIDDPAIYGVVVNKILQAREKDMTLSLDITANISEINFPKFELSRILGILLDNAIEAGEQTKDKKLIVNIRHDYERNTDVIVIANSINNINIDTVKIFEKNYSTKQTPSGYGLYEVNKFIKRNKQAHIITSIDSKNMLFTQTLTIKSNILEIAC